MLLLCYFLVRDLGDADKSEDKPSSSAEELPGLRDEVIRLPVVKAEGRIKSVSLVLGRGKELRVRYLSYCLKDTFPDRILLQILSLCRTEIKTLNYGNSRSVSA